MEWMLLTVWDDASPTVCSFKPGEQKMTAED